MRHLSVRDRTSAPEAHRRRGGDTLIHGDPAGKTRRGKIRFEPRHAETRIATREAVQTWPKTSRTRRGDSGNKVQIGGRPQSNVRPVDRVTKTGTDAGVAAWMTTRPDLLLTLVPVPPERQPVLQPSELLESRHAQITGAGTDNQ